MRTRVLRLLAVVPLLLLFNACGGDDASTEIDVETTDFAFTPDDWTVAAGEEITLNVTNNGSVTHEFVILKDGVEISSETELPETEEELLSDFVYWEEEIPAGESTTATFTAPAAGTYQIICAIENHFDAGMVGTLTAQAP